MGKVICKIRILDGAESIVHYAIWNNTSDSIEPNHPLFDTHQTAEAYQDIINKRPSCQSELNEMYHTITHQELIEYLAQKFLED